MASNEKCSTLEQAIKMLSKITNDMLVLESCICNLKNLKEEKLDSSTSYNRCDEILKVTEELRKTKSSWAQTKLELKNVRIEKEELKIKIAAYEKYFNSQKRKEEF